MEKSPGLDTSTLVSIVALAVSLIALLGTIAQVLQQYYASATGFANCGESVMGPWHTSKRRIFRLTELRFEVQFEAPVLFVCKRGNEKVPVKDAIMDLIDGTDKTIGRSHIRLAVEKSPTQNVHTADNERATWVTLLSELQWMEKDSKAWQLAEYGRNPPRHTGQATLGKETLAVALQAKQRSWDTMPAGVQKPYATSTMCHLLEMAAIMGIYWRELDRARNRYRAEGNGYVLTGERVADLGIVFTFQLCGRRRFRENRVVPVYEVKELCCGVVSTIFCRGYDDGMLDLLERLENSRKLEWLQLGSRNEIAESLVLLDCNTATAQYFRIHQQSHGHLFPVVFELVGMLGRVLHIRNTSFRMLPNPTPYVWDTKSFSLRKVLLAFHKALQTDDLTASTGRLAHLTALARDVERAIHAAQKDYDLALLEKLHDALDECDVYLKERTPRELVNLVLREHFNVVLELLNSHHGPERTRSAGHEGSDDGQQGHFAALDSASPEERQGEFINIYFAVVRPAVMAKAVQAHERRRTTQTSTRLNVTQRPAAGSAAHPLRPHGPLEEEKEEKEEKEEEEEEEEEDAEAERLDRRAGDIWCTLVFRMLCYLLLHDFSRKDVQIANKSELVGSRLPVYIV